MSPRRSHLWNPVIVNGFVYRPWRGYHMPGIYRCPLCKDITPVPNRHHWDHHYEASLKQDVSQ